MKLAHAAVVILTAFAPAYAAEVIPFKPPYADEHSIGQVFFPLIAQLEAAEESDEALYDAAVAAGHLNANDAQRAKHSAELIKPSYFRQCRVFAKQSLVWGQAPDSANRADEPLMVSAEPSGGFSTAEAEAELGKPAVPSERIRCMIAYQSLVDRSMNLLGRSDTARIVKYDVSRRMTYAVDDLKKRANRAFWAALADQRPARDSAFWNQFFARGEQKCRVPTPTGLKAGKSEFSCGPFLMNQHAMVFVEGGRIFSAETVHGQEIKFAELLKPAP